MNMSLKEIFEEKEYAPCVVDFFTSISVSKGNFIDFPESGALIEKYKDLNMNKTISLKIPILYIIIIFSHTSAFAQTDWEEASNESLAGLAVLAYGSELGLAEGCRYPKTGEYLVRFKQKLFEVRISQAKKNQFMAEFEKYRRESYDTVKQGEPEFRDLYCTEGKDSYLDSDVWQDDWVISGN